MIIAGVVAALVVVVGLMAFSSQQAADQARARELAARRQKQEAEEQAAAARQRQEAAEKARKQAESKARLEEKRRQDEQERAAREARLQQAAQAHAAAEKQQATPVEEKENDEPSEQKQRTLRLLETKCSFDFIDAPLAEIVLEVINRRTGIRFDADGLDEGKANAAINLMPQQMAVKEILMYALRQANADTTHDDDITCFVTNDGVVHLATVGYVEKNKQAANAIFAAKDVSSTAGDPPLEAQPAWHEEQMRKAAAKAEARKAMLQAVPLSSTVKLEMVPIKAGQFMMGCPPDERKIFTVKNEGYRSVTLTRDFWIGKYEVTQGQWKAIMGKNPAKFQKGDNYPVEMVSWNEAKEFCDKLNARFKDDLPPGYRFDLPTEAQWEYACRAGTTTALNNSQKLTYRDNPKADKKNLGAVAWYKGNSGGATRQVGTKLANRWGVYDMHGNVCEWCRDPYSENYDADPEFLRRSSTSMIRVYRGGCWNDAPEHCRSARRWGDGGVGNFCDKIGFRLAVVADPDYHEK